MLITGITELRQLLDVHFLDIYIAHKFIIEFPSNFVYTNGESISCLSFIITIFDCHFISFIDNISSIAAATSRLYRIFSEFRPFHRTNFFILNASQCWSQKWSILGIRADGFRQRCLLMDSKNFVNAHRRAKASFDRFRFIAKFPFHSAPITGFIATIFQYFALGWYLYHHGRHNHQRR